MSQTTPLVHIVSDEEAQGQAKEIFDHFINNSKKVPKWARVMANNPDILAGFFSMFKATMDDSPLPKEFKWKVAQVVSDLNQCEFCVDVTNSQLKQFGLSDEDIANIENNADDREKVAIEFAKETTQCAYKIKPELIKKAKSMFNDAELVELTAVVGLFNYINKFNDALGVLPEAE